MGAKVLGISDEVITCELCGKQNLKCTVALDLSGEGDEAVYYGRDCAGMVLYGRKSAANTARVVRDFENERAKQDKATRDAAWKIENDRWQGFLSRNGAGIDTFSRIQSLGGYAATRARYAAEISA